MLYNTVFNSDIEIVYDMNFNKYFNEQASSVKNLALFVCLFVVRFLIYMCNFVIQLENNNFLFYHYLLCLGRMFMN